MSEQEKPINEAQLLIEPAARRMGRWPAAAPDEHQIELSKAISLKRIADALDGMNLTHPLNAYGETIGDCIQGQHERGLRGIPNP